MPNDASKTAIRNWEKQADSFAIFNLCLFCPWTIVPLFRPRNEFTRNDLVDFGQNLLDLTSLELVGPEESTCHPTSPSRLLSLLRSSFMAPVIQSSQRVPIPRFAGYKLFSVSHTTFHQPTNSKSAVNLHETAGGFLRLHLPRPLLLLHPLQSLGSTIKKCGPSYMHLNCEQTQPPACLSVRLELPCSRISWIVRICFL